jgi:putative ubiquitin-RnfH superfamily antitoxin RatB of RatAB toxin-antitoxin module
MVKMITVNIIYALDSEQIWQGTVELPSGSIIADALKQSHFYEDFPELLDQVKGVGIFGQVKPLDDNVADGDRVEVYRALNFDPMESRRRRAAHKKAGILKRKHLKPDRSKRFEYIEHKDKDSKRREYE